MSELVLLALFTVAVFWATLFPLLLLTQSPRGGDDEDDAIPWGEEVVLYDHPLTLDRIWHTFSGTDRLR